MNTRVTVKFLKENYSKREVMVPMRDGVRLYTALYEPLGYSGRPVILIRTPFPLNPYGKTFTRDLRGYMSLFASQKYIIVYQNVRGCFMSEGDFENVRPFDRSIPRGVPGNAGPCDEASDTFDTVEWLLENLSTNGNVGVKGMSYPGFYATMAALSGHPAIKAVSPQAPVTDWFMGDDAHIGGVFQLPTYLFGASFFRPRKGRTIRWPRPLDIPEGDLYDYFLEKGSNPAAALAGEAPFFKDILDHPTYDEFWKSRNPLNSISGKKLPPTLVVGGWFDAEDSYGAFETYRRIKEEAPETELYLCAGPWYHGAWKKTGYETLGDLYFTPDSAEYFREKVEYPFFAKYLEGKGDGPSAKVEILPSGETLPPDVRRPQWQHMRNWPPQSEERKLYLNLEDSLSATPVLERGSFFCTLTDDPRRPVPYTGGILEHFSREAFVADQRFASRRPDVLTFSMPVLKEELRIEGRVVVHLSIFCDEPGTDMNIIVKLMDRRPDGYQLPVRIGARPLRFADSFEHARLPQAPGSCRMDIELTDIAHHFPVGHQLMLQVQASMFPLLALQEREHVSQVSISLGWDSPSYITLPVCRNL